MYMKVLCSYQRKMRLFIMHAKCYVEMKIGQIHQPEHTIGILKHSGGSTMIQVSFFLAGTGIQLFSFTFF